MKHLKLYEDFNSSDILEDIKWIMIEISEDINLIGNLSGDDIFLYEIEDYKKIDLVVANKRLQDIGYRLLNCAKNSFLIIKEELLDVDELDGVHYIGSIKLLGDKVQHITDQGYDFDFIIKEIEIKDVENIILKCHIKDGKFTNIYSGQILNLLDALNDQEIGDEVKSELDDTLLCFLVGKESEIIDYISIEFC